VSRGGAGTGAGKWAVLEGEACRAAAEALRREFWVRPKELLTELRRRPHHCPTHVATPYAGTQTLYVFLLLFTFTFRQAGPRFEAGELNRDTYLICLVTTYQ
jgi:hypothetical protein